MIGVSDIIQNTRMQLRMSTHLFVCGLYLFVQGSMITWIFFRRRFRGLEQTFIGVCWGLKCRQKWLGCSLLKQVAT